MTMGQLVGRLRREVVQQRGQFLPWVPPCELPYPLGRLAHGGSALRPRAGASRGGRRRKEGLDRHDPSRPSRRARSGSRPADAKANAPRTPTPEQAQRNSAPAAKHAARPAIPAGAATTPARAVRPTPTSAQPTSAATPAANSCASGRAISAAFRRQVWQRDGGRLQLRRCTDRAPLQLNASDRDRPHRPACAGRRRRSSQPQTSVWRAHHRHRHAQGAPRSVSHTRNPEDPIRHACGRQPTSPCSVRCRARRATA